MAYTQTMMGGQGPPQGMTMANGMGPPGYGGPPGGPGMNPGMMNNPGDPRPTPQSCVDGGPCGIAHLCFEPEGTMTNENWTYVGEGKGGYCKMQTYNYVGDGAGTIKKEVQKQDPGKYVKWACQGFIGLTVLAGLLAILYSVLVAPQDDDMGQEGQMANHTAGATPVNMQLAGTTQSFDCNAEYFNWVEAWDNDKKSYCCQKYSRGCKQGAQVAPGQPQLQQQRQQQQQQQQQGAQQQQGPQVKPLQQPAPGAPQQMQQQPMQAQHPRAQRQQQQPQRMQQPPSQAPVQQQPASEAESAQKFDCEEKFSTWVRDWPVQKQAWCCKTARRGCLGSSQVKAPAKASTAARGAAPAAQATQAGAGAPQKVDCTQGDPWKDHWEVNKRIYCCLQAKVGCPTQAPEAVAAAEAKLRAVPNPPSVQSVLPVAAATGACNARCPATGTRTCGFQVVYAATHKFKGQPNACASAHQLVLSKCSGCSGCSLAASGCFVAVHAGPAPAPVLTPPAPAPVAPPAPTA